MSEACRIFTRLNLSRYQLFILFCIYPASYTMFAANILWPVFAHAAPFGWYCLSDKSENPYLSDEANLEFWNSSNRRTIQDALNEQQSQDFLNKSTEFFSIVRNSDFSNGLTRNCSIACENRTFVTDYASVASQLGLVCDRVYAKSTIASLQMIGLVIGNLVFGQISDVFGRKPTLLAGIVGLTLFSTATTFCTTWEAIGALRFVCGFFLGGYTVGLNTLVMEILPTGDQRLFSRAFACMWGEGRMILTLVAYLTRDWQLTYQIINLASLPVLTFLIGGLVVESPRWLHAKGYSGRLAKAQEWIGRVNQAEAQEFATTEPKSLKDEKVYTYRDLFGSPEIRKRTALCALIWFSATFVSYGLDILSGDLPGDRFSNQFIICVIICLIKPAIFFIDAWLPGFNRRMLHQASIGVPSVCIAIAAVLTALDSKNQSIKTAMTSLSIIGLVAMEYQFDAAYLFCMELFPTVCRSVGLAFSNIVGRFGNVIAPQAVYLGEFWKPAPLVTFACLGFLVLAISIALLPDTKRSPLPDTLDFATNTPLNSDADGASTLLITDAKSNPLNNSAEESWNEGSNGLAYLQRQETTRL